MNGKLEKALTECIEAIENGADAESCLQRYPDQAEELRPLLGMRSDLDSAGGAEPDIGGYDRGHSEMLGALADEERRGRRMVPFLAPVMTKAAAVVAGLVLLTGVAGASAALGGPDIADEVLTVTGINHAPDAAQNGKDHANPNAFEGSENAGQGRDNASEQGQENANPNAGEGSNNSGGNGPSENASQNGKDHANSNSVEGVDAGGDEDGGNGPSENASQNGRDHANSNSGEGVDASGDDDGGNGPSENASQNGKDHANANGGDDDDDGDGEGDGDDID